MNAHCVIGDTSITIVHSPLTEAVSEERGVEVGAGFGRHVVTVTDNWHGASDLSDPTSLSKSVEIWTEQEAAQILADFLNNDGPDPKGPFMAGFPEFAG